MSSRRVPLVILLCLFWYVSPAFSSVGDRSPLYQKCVRSCMTANCTDDGEKFKPQKAALQDRAARALLWNCTDECRYHCMWQTAAAFQERGIPLPKFHGKWPFKRILGVQEPASALFSALNLAVNVHMYLRIVRDRRFTLGETPMLIFWHVFCAVVAHAWLWSTVFHTRDTPFTEFMDYACALSMIVASVIAAVVRTLYKRRVVILCLVAAILVYFMEHLKYLHQGAVDYDFNILVNVSFGVAASVLWLSWSAHRLRTEGRRARYLWRLAAFVLGSGLGLALELFDFPPLMTHFDAHSLWHLSTAPLPLWFFRFVMDDMEYLQGTLVDKKAAAKLN